MHLDPNLLALAGIALWLGGSFTFVGIARDWCEDRLTRCDRREQRSNSARLGTDGRP